MKRYHEGQLDKGHHVEKAHGNEGELASSLGPPGGLPPPPSPEF